MRTAVATILVLAWTLGLPTPALRAQQRSSTELALSFTSGSAFGGTGIGLAGASFASRSAPWYESGYGADRYGVYDGGDWGSPLGYRGYSHGYHAYGRYRCADVWSILDGPYYGAVQAGFYDDWFYFSDLYYDCVLRGPSWVYHRYHTYRPYHVSFRPYRPFRPRVVFISIAIVDPFWPAWGPFHAYDPWGWYWSNWVVYRAPRVRTVYVTPPVIYRRPSPVYVAGTTYKEDPQGGAQGTPPRRSAIPRGGAALGPSASAPPAARDGNGIQAPPRRSGPPSGVLGGSAPTPSDAASTREGTRGAERRRSGEAAGRPAAPAAPGPVGGSTRGSDGQTLAQPSTPSATNDAERFRRSGGAGVLVQPSTGRPSDAVRERQGAAGSATQTPSEPERRPTVERLPSTSRQDPQAAQQPSEPAPVELIQPRRGDPQWTTAPRAQPQPTRPSDAAPRTGAGAAARSAPTQPESATRGQPSGARQVPERTTQTPEAGPAPSREAQPERRAEPAPSREVERPSREVQPPAREVQPPQRQPEPRAQPQPQTREAPSRPSSPPPAQAAPAPSSSGGRPAPAPRRPGDE